MLGKGEHRLTHRLGWEHTDWVGNTQTGLGKALHTEGRGKKGVAKLTRTKPEVVVLPGSLLTLLISSRSSACIQIGLWSSADDILSEEVRQRIWVLCGEPESTGQWSYTDGVQLSLAIYVWSPSQTLPLTIHRSKFLHMGTGQDLFVQSLSLRVLALL